MRPMTLSRPPGFHEIYSDPEKYFELYELAEKLVDIEDAFQNWRFKHMYTVQRIIGNRQAERVGRQVCRS